MIFGTSPGIIDGCFHPNCIRKNPDGSPTLPRYVRWLRVGERYCEHLQERHGHENAEWLDQYKPMEQEPGPNPAECQHSWRKVKGTHPQKWRCSLCPSTTRNPQ